MLKDHFMQVSCTEKGSPLVANEFLPTQEGSFISKKNVAHLKNESTNPQIHPSKPTPHLCRRDQSLRPCGGKMLEIPWVLPLVV